VLQRIRPISKKYRREVGIQLLFIQKLEHVLPLVPLWVKLAVIVLLSLPNLWCILQAVKKEFRNPPEKILWLLLGIFLPVLGGILYLAWGRTRAEENKL
jgi:hypothetical protein